MFRDKEGLPFIDLLVSHSFYIEVALILKDTKPHGCYFSTPWLLIYTNHYSNGIYIHCFASSEKNPLEGVRNRQTHRFTVPSLMHPL